MKWAQIANENGLNGFVMGRVDIGHVIVFCKQTLTACASLFSILWRSQSIQIKSTEIDFFL